MKFDSSRLIFIRDTREQDGFIFPGRRVVDETLSVADYSVKGLESSIRVERKSLSDLIGSLTHGRERFRREVEFLRAYRFKCVVVEASLLDVMNQNYRSKATPNSILASCASWSGRYLPIHFCGNREGAERYCKEFLIQSAKVIYQALENIHKSMMEDVPEGEASA